MYTPAEYERWRDGVGRSCSVPACLIGFPLALVVILLFGPIYVAMMLWGVMRSFFW